MHPAALASRDTPPTAPTRSPAHRHPPTRRPKPRCFIPRRTSRQLCVDSRTPRWPGNACRHVYADRTHRRPSRHAGRCGCRRPDVHPVVERTPVPVLLVPRDPLEPADHVRRQPAGRCRTRAASHLTRRYPGRYSHGTAASTLALRARRRYLSGTAPDPDRLRPSAPERPPRRSRSESAVPEELAHHPAPTV